MSEHGCSEAELRELMSDVEFWEHVFRPIAEDVADHFEEYYAFDPYGADREYFPGYSCVRCGIELAEADSFCDDCVSETDPYEEPTW